MEQNLIRLKVYFKALERIMNPLENDCLSLYIIFKTSSFVQLRS